MDVNAVNLCLHKFRKPSINKNEILNWKNLTTKRPGTGDFPSYKIYSLIAKIYNTLGNKELCQKISNPNLRLEAINSLKSELSGIYRKGK